MIEVYRDDDLLALKMPSHVRSFPHRAYNRGSLVRFRVPDLIFAMSELGKLYLASEVADGEMLIPRAPNMDEVGAVCLGDEINQVFAVKDDLDRKLRTGIDLFFTTRFGDTPRESHFTVGRKVVLEDFLYQAAGKNRRRFRKHVRYIRVTNKESEWWGSSDMDRIQTYEEQPEPLPGTRIYAVFLTPDAPFSPILSRHVTYCTEFIR